MKNIIKEIKVNSLLKDMIIANKELYEKILDTPGFALAFNELTKLASEDTDSSEIIYQESEVKKLTYLAFAKGYMIADVNDNWDTVYFEPWFERHKKK